MKFLIIKSYSHSTTHSEQYVEIVQKRCKLLDFYAVALFRSNPVTEIIKSNSTSYFSVWLFLSMSPSEITVFVLNLLLKYWCFSLEFIKSYKSCYCLTVFKQDPLSSCCCSCHIPCCMPLQNWTPHSTLMYQISCEDFVRLSLLLWQSFTSVRKSIKWKCG